MTQHVLAVDLGTGGPKVAVVTLDGEVLAHEIETTELILFPGGGAEQDPADWWRAITTAARRLLARDVVDPATIVAVALTSQWFGTVAIGPEGDHLHNAVIWMDSRGGKYAEALTDGFPKVSGYSARKALQWVRITGGIPSNTGKDPLGHILFLRNEYPEVYERAAVFLEPVDYLAYRLTGKIAATPASITGHWLTDNRNLDSVRYDPTLVAASGIPRTKLPDLVPTASVLGTVMPHVAAELGVPETAKVIMGTADNASAAVGSGAVADFATHLYIGTSSWVTCHMSEKKTDLIRSVTTLPSGIPNKYIVAVEQESAGLCVTSLRDKWLYGEGPLGVAAPDDFFARFNEAAASVPAGSEGLLFFPWINGERTPVEDHLIRGGFFNLQLTHNRSHMARSVLEGVALNTAWMHQAVERFTKRRLDNIRFIGGGARSELWCQILADCLNRKIQQVDDPATAGSRGAALIAAVTLGHLSSWDDIGDRVGVTKVFSPNPATRAVYQQLLGVFTDFYGATKKLSARLNHH